jgi:hypothetical protein
MVYPTLSLVYKLLLRSVMARHWTSERIHDESSRSFQAAACFVHGPLRMVVNVQTRWTRSILKGYLVYHQKGVAGVIRPGRQHRA